MRSCNIQVLVTKLWEFGSSSFENVAKDIETSKELYGNILSDDKNASSLGNSHFKKFIKSNLFECTKYLFSPVKINK